MEVRPEPVKATRRVPVMLPATVVVLAIAVVAVVASFAARPATPSSDASGAGANVAAAATASPVPSPSGGPGRIGRGIWPGMMVGGMAGGMGNRGNGSFVHDITISTISGSRVGLVSANGWSRTFDSTGVTMTRAGNAITVADLKVGDHVAISERQNSDGTYTVTSLTVVLDQVGGTVTRMDASTITVSTFGNGTATIKTTSSTVYRRAGQTISRSDIAVGERLAAAGTKASDGSLTAEAVDVQPDVVYGSVTKVSGDTITVATAGGGTATVSVSTKTTIQVPGKTSPTVTDITVSSRIVAQGVLGSDGVLNATTVRVGGPHGMGMWGNGNGFGWPGPAIPKPTPTAGPSG